MKRERSRSPLTPPPAFKSPIPTKPLPTSSSSQKEEKPKETKINNTKSKTETQQATTSEVVRYTGRPGEKKFSNRCRLFVANLNTNLTEEDVRDLFSPYGELSESYFNKDKGFAFVRLVSLLHF